MGVAEKNFIISIVQILIYPRYPYIHIILGVDE